MAAQKSDGKRVVSENRRARRDYEIEDVVEAGLVLTGTEVKALREGRATIAEKVGGIIGCQTLFDAAIPALAAFAEKPRFVF